MGPPARRTEDRGAVARYDAVLGDVVGVIEEARRGAARSVNAVMTATYWLVGRRIVEEEQRGRRRAGYGELLIDRLAVDLESRFGRGFGPRNLHRMRAFFLAYREILTTLSSESGIDVESLQDRFPLPWSHYCSLLTVRNDQARTFYQAEALRGGWSIRQLRRQIETQFYERTALSRDKTKMLTKGAKAHPEDAVTPEEEVKDPYVLEFLGLRDEYSETDLEEALIRHLESFLLELGGDFAFVGRQRRLRVGDTWCRVDLVFFHRRLRCSVVIDLKLGELTAADVGQMHLYLNYAREHWTIQDENPPVGLILCARKDHAVAKYALEGLGNKVLAAEYRMALPDERVLAEMIGEARRRVEERRQG